MTITAKEGSAKPFNLCARLALAFIAVMASTFIVVSFGQICGFHLREAMPAWMEWTWLASAYLGLFLSARFMGGVTRAPEKTDKTSVFSRESERSLRRAESFFAVIAVAGLAGVTAFEVILLAPARFSYAATLMLWLPMVLGLFIGDIRGFYKFRFRSREVLL